MIYCWYSCHSQHHIFAISVEIQLKSPLWMWYFVFGQTIANKFHLNTNGIHRAHMRAFDNEFEIFESCMYYLNVSNRLLICSVNNMYYFPVLSWLDWQKKKKNEKMIGWNILNVEFFLVFWQFHWEIINISDVKKIVERIWCGEYELAQFKPTFQGVSVR